jgi:hypothetical protein
MKKATAILGIAAPVSWVLVPLLGFLCSRGTDGGWSGMAAIFFALAVVLVAHVAGLIGLVTILVLKKKRNENTGKGIVFALSYYVLIAAFFLLAMGPKEFWNDISALLSGLFRKI